MTVYNELNKIAYIGDTAQTLYPIPFEYISTEDIKVSIYTSGNEFVENWMYSTQYVIEDKNIKILSGYEIDNTKKLLILRKVDLVQDNKYREGGDFPAKSTETSFDKLTMITQQLQETLDRCVKVEVLDIQSPDELLQSVYDKLDSATTVAQEAIAAADEATIAAEKATTAVEATQKQLIQTQEYVTESKQDIANTVEAGKTEVNNAVTVAKAEVKTTVDEATLSISDAITQATEDVKQQALEAAQEAIDTAAAQATTIVIDHAENVIKPELNDLVTAADEDATSAAESARVARVWATGEDAEVHEIEADEHSSRGYADLAMAIANTPEDVPVDTSKLLALEIIKGPKGDPGEADFSGDINFEGSFNVHGDDNHPVKVTSLAGATASGFQVVDSNGAGESDFEHYASGDRYGTRIANKSTATGKTVNVDLYQTTAGKSVLDLSKPDTILAPQLLDIIFPIGSYYLSEEDSCPLADWMEGCQWEKVGTSLVSGTEAAVVGTGMALGLTNGSSNSALQVDSNGTYLGARQGGYGYSAGRDVGSGNAGLGGSKSLGVTTDPTKSGIIANLPTITVNIFRRTM